MDLDEGVVINLAINLKRGHAKDCRLIPLTVLIAHTICSTGTVHEGVHYLVHGSSYSRVEPNSEVRHLRGQKLNSPVLMATSSGGGKSHRLHLQDKISDLVFLVDLSADISVVPRTKYWQGKPFKFKLYAANESVINVYKEFFSVNFDKDKILN